MELGKQERLFLSRVALELVGQGIEKPTQDDITEAMQRTLQRDIDLVNGFIALENRKGHRGLGNDPESPGTILARSIYESIRASR